MPEPVPEPLPGGSAGVRCVGVRKMFSQSAGVAEVSLDVPGGTICALVGPSGAGKTTLVRCIAGLERPDAGDIFLRDACVNDPRIRIPAHRRRIGFVFQGLALWPHRTAGHHIELALAGRHIARRLRPERIRDLLALVGLTGRESSFPDELSGGERQRLAIARALAGNPHLLICDEPFTGFDEDIRAAIREEIRRLTRALGIATLFITHDHAEALALADVVAVLNAGRIEQIAAPREILDAPASVFVAGFIGRCEMFPATRRADGSFETPLGIVAASKRISTGDAALTVAIRPDEWRLSTGEMGSDATGAGIGGVVESVAVRAGDSVASIGLDTGHAITAHTRLPVRAGQSVRVLPPERARVFGGTSFQSPA